MNLSTLLFLFYLLLFKYVESNTIFPSVQSEELAVSSQDINPLCSLIAATNVICILNGHVRWKVSPLQIHVQVHGME